MIASLAAALCVATFPMRALPTVTWHDNLQPAGRVTAEGVHLDLDIQRGMWYPNGEDRAGTDVLAFAVRGQNPTTPGPLLRLRLGTRVTASVRNTTTEVLVVHGLGVRRSLAVFDSLVIPPSATVQTSFVADAEGTFFYWGAQPGETLEDRKYEAALLSGALVVDPAVGEVPPDRILMIDVLVERLMIDSTLEEAGDVLAINGRPWPHTERMTHAVGDSIRWRLINASPRSHPMHLHGFYFRVDAAGDWQQDTLFDVRQRRMAVTEHMEPGSTRTVVWSPDRPGGWLFHCHLSFHATPNAPLGKEFRENPDYFLKSIFEDNRDDAAHHVEHHMGGLMLVTRVEPKGGVYPALRPVERTLRLQVIATPDSNIFMRRYGYGLVEGTGTGASSVGPAPVLVLQRGEPTDVVIHNSTPEATSIHWHGVEIDSYSDGVVGVGGYAHMPTPPIMPGDSFIARITAPRSGSFMYHTHVSDIRQQGKGLAGALLVVDDRAAYDVAHERVYLAQMDLNEKGSDLEPRLNRRSAGMPPDTVRARETYRLRLMNLTLAGAGLRFQFVSDGAPAVWRMVAKDGFELPGWQQDVSASPRAVSIGETMDVLWKPFPGSSGWFELRSGGGALIVRQRIEVIAER